MHVPNQIMHPSEKQLSAQNVDARIVDSAVKIHKSGSAPALDRLATDALKTDDREPVDKRRAMRALVGERFAHGSLLSLSRVDFRRVRKPIIRDARMTEQLQRKQRLDRERRAEEKHVEQFA